MTDQQIEDIIDSINSGTHAGWVFHHHLVAEVHYARVWPEFPNESIPDVHGYDFYFIMRPESDFFVGAVLDMKTDLHLFIKEGYRRQKLMSSTLKNIILPHLFSHPFRTRQNVTYRDSEAKSFLIKSGFTIIDEERAFIENYQTIKMDFSPRKPSKMSKERINAVQDQLRRAARLVRMAKDELTECLGDHFAHTLSDLADDVEGKATDAKDYWVKVQYSEPKCDRSES